MSAKAKILFVLALILLVGAIYSNTISSPFMLDDKALVRDNPIVKDPRYLLHPDRASALPEYNLFRTRFLSTATFTLNHMAHGEGVRGYHIANIALHAANATLVFALVLMIFATPMFIHISQRGRWIAAGAALMFAAHPLQTEAVTYIMGRYVLVCALFYLASMVLYLRYRLHGSGWLYAASLLAGALAMLSKQNAATLPFALALMELCFMGPVPRRFLRLVPFAALLIIFPITMWQGGVAFNSAATFSESRSMFDADFLAPTVSSAQYALTQTKVVAMYLKLIVLPVGQNFDHDVALMKSALDWRVLTFVALHAMLLGLALVGLLRTGGLWRLAAGGVLWFYLTIAVESSILPIPMLMAEYRTYLPGLGIYVAVLSMAAIAAGGMSAQRRIAVLAGCLSIVGLLSWASYARNYVWHSELSLWQDVVAKSPMKVRGIANLAKVHLEAGRLEQARLGYEQVLELDPRFHVAWHGLGMAMLKMGDVARAREALERAVALAPRDDFKATYLSALANAFMAQQQYALAIGALRVALKLDPSAINLHYSLAVAAHDSGDRATFDREVSYLMTTAPALAQKLLGAR